MSVTSKAEGALHLSFDLAAIIYLVVYIARQHLLNLKSMHSTQNREMSHERDGTDIKNKQHSETLSNDCIQQKKQPRLDLNHGYFRFIRRNQIDRDEYDKIHEQRKSEIRERFAKKYDSVATEQIQKSNIYIPSHPNNKETEQKVEASAPCPLFNFNPQDHTTVVQQKQNAADDIIRKQVRQRIERTHATVDDICEQMANYSLQEAKSAKDSEKNGDQFLFMLEFTFQCEKKTTIGVPRNTKAARLAKSLSREYNFNDSQCRNLRIFIDEQLECRLARPTSM